MEIISCTVLQLPRTMYVKGYTRLVVHDALHPKLPKECAKIIAKPLYLIFSKCCCSSIVSDDDQNFFDDDDDVMFD